MTAASHQDILRDLRARVAEQVDLMEEGLTGFRVLTPFRLEDGDHLAIALRPDGSRWYLTDEGHTYMHLTYEMEERALQEGNRGEIISNALNAFGVEDRDGELTLDVPEGRWGDALFTFVQALLRISDVSLLTRERVRSTFTEDVEALIREIAGLRWTRGWHHPHKDPEALYTADFRVEDHGTPVLLYALASDRQIEAATISLLTFERWGMPLRSLGIFEDQSTVSRKALARFTDVCERQFSSLGERERIAAWLRHAVGLAEGVEGAA